MVVAWMNFIDFKVNLLFQLPLFLACNYVYIREHAKREKLMRDNLPPQLAYLTDQASAITILMRCFIVGVLVTLYIYMYQRN
jgi:hypothetical protein